MPRRLFKTKRARRRAIYSTAVLAAAAAAIANHRRLARGYNRNASRFMSYRNRSRRRGTYSPRVISV